MAQPNWNQIQKQFESWPSGTILQDSDNKLWVKPVQLKTHHLDGMIVSLDNGAITHHSVFGQELTRPSAYHVCLHMKNTN